MYLIESFYNWKGSPGFNLSLAKEIYEIECHAKDLFALHHLRLLHLGLPFSFSKEEYYCDYSSLHLTKTLIPNFDLLIEVIFNFLKLNEIL